MSPRAGPAASAGNTDGQGYDINGSRYHKWIRDGTPEVIWLPSLVFPQALLSAAKCMYSRSQQLSGHRVGVECVVHSIAARGKPGGDLEKNNLLHVNGVWAEGFHWNGNCIEPTPPGHLYTEMPTLAIVPHEIVATESLVTGDALADEEAQLDKELGGTLLSTAEDDQLHTFHCPLYKTHHRDELVIYVSVHTAEVAEATSPVLQSMLC